MSNDDTTAQILLTPVGVKGVFIADDAVPIKADCGHQAWIGPSSMQMVLSPFIKTQTVCWRCADPKALEKSVKEHGMLAAPGTREEMARAIGEEETEETYRRFGITEKLPGMP